jgi:tRNA threonylcarbamoyladenosine biosynthesis protein TsaB
MDLLAIDTATERCSVAVRVGGAWFERSVDTPRGHADIVLSMTDEVLRESGVRLADLDAIAFGRGPGAFTGVRIAIGVVQGLAYGAELPVVGISNLAAVAEQVRREGEAVLVCMDARMNEVYWVAYKGGPAGALLEEARPESVGPWATIDVDPAAIDVIAGTGISAYSGLAARFEKARQVVTLPRAREILLLGELALRAGRVGTAFDAQPVYLRDQVTFVKP